MARKRRRSAPARSVDESVADSDGRNSQPPWEPFDDLDDAGVCEEDLYSDFLPRPRPGYGSGRFFRWGDDDLD